MSEDTPALSRRVVDTFGGSVLGSPSEIARNGRDVAEAAGCDWRALGWPVTGRGLLAMPPASADQVAAAGILVHHTTAENLPGAAECLAISDATADLTRSPLAPKLEAVLRLQAVRGTPGRARCGSCVCAGGA